MIKEARKHFWNHKTKQCKCGCKTRVKLKGINPICYNYFKEQVIYEIYLGNGGKNER